MKIFFNILRLIWRLWFAIIVSIPILVFAPIIFFSIAFEKQKLFTWLKRVWANWVLFWMGFYVELDNQADITPKTSYMIIANHTSVMDIMVMLKIIPLPFVFVGKKELAKLPVFGYLYKKSNITVDRNSPRSRKEVYDQVVKFIKKGNSIVIYPEGGVPDPKLLLAPFKNGAFRIAIEHQLPIIPIIYYDNKRKYPYDFFKGSPGKLRVKILQVIPTKGLELSDLNDLRDYAYKLIYNELMNDQISKDFD
jgi:1-acyl-sn-glycerol-3-phosphate acyltransferase